MFFDVDIPTYNIKTEALEEALSPRTRAIMVAHTLGNPFDLKTVMNFAKKHDLYVVEDTCDALGAEYDGKKVGTFGDIGTLFYPAHHITMGEGGAVYCDSPKLKRTGVPFVIGAATAGVILAKIIHVRKGLNGSLASCHSASTINIPIAISGITSRSPICRRL